MITILGPTGDHPLGKLSDDDAGGLNVAVGVNGDVVVIAFGTSVSWIGLPPESVRELCATMLEHAAAIEARR